MDPPNLNTEASALLKYFDFVAMAIVTELGLKMYRQQKTSWLGPPGQGILRAGLHV